MKNFKIFELNDIRVKAYYTLENLYHIEESGGIDLTQLTVQALHAPPSLTQSRDILNLALSAEMPDLKERSDFIRQYMDKKRFTACNQVREFILQAMTAPEAETENESEQHEKKTLAS